MCATLVLLYHLRILTVPADAAYFNYAFLAFIRDALPPSVNVDYIRDARLSFWQVLGQPKAAIKVALYSIDI